MKHLTALRLGTAIALVTAGFAHADMVYVTTNKADGNTIMAFSQNEQGDFTMSGEYDTGGMGTGDLEIPALQNDPTHPLANGDDPLISAFSLVATEDGSHVLTVNPGDGTVSLLSRGENGALSLVNTAPTSDKFPNSIAVNGDMVVVAAVGEDNMHGSISAFKITDGELTAVEGSRRDLGARPSTVKFDSDGSHLIVSELVTGKVKSFGTADGSLSEEPTSMVDSPRDNGRFHAIPVGFEVISKGDHDVIVMSEARFLTPDYGLREGNGEVVQSPKYSWQSGSISTYTLDGEGNLALVSGDVISGEDRDNGEISACWVVAAPDGNTAWSINPLSSSYSAYSIADDGTAELTDATALKLDPATMFFGDAELSSDGSEIYQLLSNTGQIMVIGVDENNSLSVKDIASGLPELGAFGMLAL